MASANVKPYLDADRHRGNEYMNTVNQFKGLEEAMRAMGQQSVIQGGPTGFFTKALLKRCRGLKLGNAWVFVQLIFGPRWPMNQLNKNPDIA